MKVINTALFHSQPKDYGSLIFRLKIGSKPAPFFSAGRKDDFGASSQRYLQEQLEPKLRREIEELFIKAKDAKRSAKIYWTIINLAERFGPSTLWKENYQYSAYLLLGFDAYRRYDIGQAEQFFEKAKELAKILNISEFTTTQINNGKLEIELERNRNEALAAKVAAERAALEAEDPEQLVTQEIEELPGLLSNKYLVPIPEIDYYLRIALQTDDKALADHQFTRALNLALVHKSEMAQLQVHWAMAHSPHIQKQSLHRKTARDLAQKLGIALPAS